MRDINEVVEEYRGIVAQEKLLKERKKELADTIKQNALENGVVDSNGNHYITNDRFIFGFQSRKTIKINQTKAKEFFEENKLWDRVVKIEESVDENEVEKLLEEGTISIDDLETITDTKEVKAVDVREIEQEEDMPLIETSRKKSILKRKGNINA